MGKELVAIEVEIKVMLVIAGHSRPKDGVASLAYVPAIPLRTARLGHRNRDGRDEPGHDNL